MKRSPLKRKTPMRRTHFKQKAPRQRTASEGGWPEYLTWIRTLDCCACKRDAPSHAHHSTGAGMALKPPDDEAMPLCYDCHRDFHDGNGFAADWGKAQRKAWQGRQVELCRRAWFLTRSPVP